MSDIYTDTDKLRISRDGRRGMMNAFKCPSSDSICYLLTSWAQWWVSVVPGLRGWGRKLAQARGPRPVCTTPQDPISSHRTEIPQISSAEDTSWSNWTWMIHGSHRWAQGIRSFPAPTPAQAQPALQLSRGAAFLNKICYCQQHSWANYTQRWESTVHPPTLCWNEGAHLSNTKI